MPPTRDLGFIHEFVPAQSGSSHPVTLLLLHGTGSDFRRIATIPFASVGDAAAHIWGETILAVRSQERPSDRPPIQGSLRQNSRYKNGTTKRCALAFLAIPYRALQSDRCLVNTT